MEAMTAERRGSAAWRWRSAAAISPGEESAGSTGSKGAGAVDGGATAAVVRGFPGGVLTILRERNEILVERSSSAEAARWPETGSAPAAPSGRVSATYGGAGVEGQRSSQLLGTVGIKLCGPDEDSHV